MNICQFLCPLLSFCLDMMCQRLVTRYHPQLVVVVHLMLLFYSASVSLLPPPPPPIQLFLYPTNFSNHRCQWCRRFRPLKNKMQMMVVVRPSHAPYHLNLPPATKRMKLTPPTPYHCIQTHSIIVNVSCSVLSIRRNHIKSGIVTC